MGRLEGRTQAQFLWAGGANFPFYSPDSALYRLRDPVRAAGQRGV